MFDCEDNLDRQKYLNRFKRLILTVLCTVMCASCSLSSLFGDSKNSGNDGKPSDGGEGIGGYLVNPGAVVAFKRSGSNDFILSGDKESLSQTNLNFVVWELPEDKRGDFLSGTALNASTDLEEVYRQENFESDTFSALVTELRYVVVHVYEGVQRETISLNQLDTYLFTSETLEANTNDRIIQLGCAVDAKSSGVDELLFLCGRETEVLNVLDKIVFNLCENGTDESLKAQLFCSDYPFESLVENQAELFVSSGFDSIGDVEIEVQYNDEKLLLSRLSIRYVAGLDPPKDCKSGSEVYSVNEFNGESLRYNHKSSQTEHTFASYRICRSFIVGDERELVATGVLVANPGPVCHHPPCTPVQSQGNGTFESPINISGAANFDAPTGKIYDVDGDGDEDYVVLQWNIGAAVDSFVYYGLGNGQFTTPATALNTTIEGAYGLAIADYNNDNQLDLFVSSHRAASDNVVFWGQSGAGYSSSINLAKGSANQMHSVSAGDVDADGNTDVVVGSISSGAQSLVYKSNGTTFSAATAIGSIPYVSEHVILGDFDKDADLDLIELTGYLQNDSDVNRFYQNPGNGNFAAVVGNQFNTEIGSDYEIALGDLDRDGHLDAVLCSLTQTIRIYYGKGNGQFEDAVDLQGFTNDEVIHCVLGDFNNDHILDLVAARSFEENFISFGKGNREFDNPLSLTSAKNRTRHIAVGDLNNDNKLDLIFVNDGVDQILLGK